MSKKNRGRAEKRQGGGRTQQKDKKLAYLKLPNTGLESMTGWPGTLPIPRMNQLVELMKLLAAEQPVEWQYLGQELVDDLNACIRSEGASYYGNRATIEIASNAGSNQGSETPGMMEQLLLSAYQADTETAIGGVMDLGQEGTPTKGGDNHTGIFQVLRDPLWMGASRIYPSLRGHHTIIVESDRRPERPGIIMTFRDQDNIPKVQDEPIPPGEAELLEYILRWHGAASCRWVIPEELPLAKLRG